MDISLIITIISVIENLLVTIGPSISNDAVSKIISVLESVLPLIGNALPTLYQSIKNIIQSLTSSDTITQDQIDALEALDAKVDADFEAAADAVDPDKQS